MVKKRTLLSFATTFLICAIGFAQSQETPATWRLALPGWQYEFPADHAIHPDFKTEWWYFTGNLQNDQGHAYGYELTFFRQGVIPPRSSGNKLDASVGTAQSRFVQNDFKFAHFAISDISGSKFVYTQKISRGAFGEAGFGRPPDPRVSGQSRTGERAERLAWLENWSLQPQANGSWHITAQADTSPPMWIDLTIDPRKPPTIEGTDGVSQKAAGLGNASHYYSFTRMRTTGILSLGQPVADQSVRGESWFDHEWASNQLAPDQVGWNWFCFQFDDQTELMLYAMRRRDGSIDPASSGTVIDANGGTEHLQREQIRLRPLKIWHSEQTGADYPIEWQVNIPSRGIELTVRPRMENQELVLPAISYWEGAIQASGRRNKTALTGLGYMELTGYAGALKGLQRQPDAGADLRAPTH